jgi:hypothetical protein
MNADDMKVGQRVRLVKAVYDDAPHPGNVVGLVEAGATGTITDLFADADHEMGEVFAYVRFDAPIEALEDWDNTLHVWREDGDVLPSDFEVIA